MTIDRAQPYLISLVRELQNLPTETEWVEFKGSNEQPELIGEYISALANSATLHGKVNAYMVWGLDDATHEVIGTTFDWRTARQGGEPLENWLLHLLSPKIDFRFYALDINGLPVVLLEISAASRHIVQFKHVEYIRVGSIKKKLKEFPEKERELWRLFDRVPFEQEVAADHLSEDDVLRLLDYPSYFELLKLPLPANRSGIFDALTVEGLIFKEPSGQWSIRNIGAILFAKKLQDFRTLKRKAVRVILYKGNSKLEAIREQEGGKGYASGFESLIQFLMGMIPSNEVIEKAIRKIQMSPCTLN